VPDGLGAAVGGELDQLWDRLGRPDPFVVVHDAAGDGRLASAILTAGPRCAVALRYLLVEPNPALRAEHQRHLPLEAPEAVLGPTVVDEDDVTVPVARIGPVVASRAELPAGLSSAVVLAVGWVSRLVADVAWTESGTWWETRLAPAGDGWEEVVVPVPGPPTSDAASDWLVAARHAAGGGTVMVVDHVASGSVLARLVERQKPARRRHLAPFGHLEVLEWDAAVNRGG
jgi:hypothetical protein